MNPLEYDVAIKVLEAIALATQRAASLRSQALLPTLDPILAAYYNGQADNYDENITRLSNILGA